MNYAWEAALMADAKDIPRENIRYVPVDNGSPYTEIVDEIINEKSLENSVVQINPIYRFSGVFSEIFSKNLFGYEQSREMIFRIFMQYIVQLDLRQGLNKQEYNLRFLVKDILHGVFGQEASETILLFEKNQLRQLLRLILKLYRCGSSIYLFKEVIRYLYPDSLVYVSNEDVRQILIYVGRSETNREKMKLEFLEGVFLPIYYQVFIFWEYHFGIIDVEETMELDNMVLF